ncbi:centrosomal protein of 104 kDa-like isoform X1 [Pecten maximus]|uniref:centrosomal protein of 104 kDa-like isoform X1 n=1 Tax=Pecten maximus TaxID=6579 RepID=UPI001458AFBD|nr:centrosomal protein of 104 kDa-like isoform X1 [Pecten maximus]XP_033763313.1 centrosomal protein of 104 kDa-like isoform X1 [Pecten maximus]
MPRKLPFRVVHVSGQDDGYKAKELNTHSPLTRGWQAAKFCLYPQDLIVQLDGRSRLRKIQILSHQFLVATKIEFLVGDVPEDMSLSVDNARYTKLGYVSLSDNEKTAFKSRELKSVHVDAIGQYLKILVHKNHINKHNVYNQVGVIAVNIIGDIITRPSDLNDRRKRDYYSDPDRARKLEYMDDDENQPRPDYISPLDDLAFDMYQDPEIASIIRKLEKKKQEAVIQERFDYAKKLKTAILDLQKVGEKLGKYEVEKRQAVENEDYDKAKLKKVQMEEYRLQIYHDLNLGDLLETTGSRHPQHVDLEPVRDPTPSRLSHLSPRTPPRTPPPRTPYDERPLPAMKNKGDTTQREQISSPRSRTPYDERQLPVNNYTKRYVKPTQIAKHFIPPPVTEEEEQVVETGGGGITGEPEPMSEKDLREASAAVDVFGEPLVSKAYSKTWSYREDALLAVYKQMSEMSTSVPKEEVKSALKGAVYLCKRAIRDKVYAVFKAGLHLLKMLLTEYCSKHRLGKSDIVHTVELVMPELFNKSADTAARNRDDAKNFLKDMANFPEVRPTNVVPHECLKPIKMTLAPRPAQSRVEIIEMLYKSLGVKGNTGLTIDNIMNFCVVALGHTSGEVRDVSERIIRTLYKENPGERQTIKDHLPQDDERTRKNTMYRQLFEYFDKVDGKPSKSDMKRQKVEEESRKQEEIEALQNQLQQLRSMAAGKQPVDENVLKTESKKPSKKVLNKSKPKPKDDDDASVYNMDHICIFCEEQNPSFTEDGLDLHYWKHCPMLKRCTNCKQVVEIASYTDHLLTECEAKGNYARCPQCTEAIPKSEYAQHIADKSCKASEPDKNHCPLCHQNIYAGEDGWKKHLMGKDGCKQNPRRLLALNKQPAQGQSKGRPGVKGGVGRGRKR